jgi:multidrug efflux system outer membrane protein
MNMSRISSSICAVLLLSGCAMAPKYERPEPPVPPGWPDEAHLTNTTGTAAADISWPAFFPDPRLQEIIETALVNNRDLRLAALNVEKSRALYGIQRAELLPALQVAGAGSRLHRASDFTSPGESRTSTRFDVDLGIASWELDFFGRIRSLKKQALQEYLGTEQARCSAQIALVSEVARTYYVMAADRENQRLAQSTLQAQQEVHGMIRQQHEAGVAAEIDLHRSQTLVDAARGALARYSQLVAQDRNAIILLAGAPVPEELLPMDLTGVIPPGDVAAGLPSEVLLRRPDIIAAEHRLQGAYAFIGTARAAFFPRVALTATLGSASDELSGLFGSGSDTWSFVPRLSLPIFDARTWAAYRVSDATREIALAQYEKAIQTAFREVADALAARSTIDEQIAAQQSIVDSSQTICRLSDQRFAQGIDGYLSVLDAQRSLFAAQQGLVSLRLAGLASRIRLYAVLGGGGTADNAD